MSANRGLDQKDDVTSTINQQIELKEFENTEFSFSKEMLETLQALQTLYLDTPSEKKPLLLYKIATNDLRYLRKSIKNLYPFYGQVALLFLFKNKIISLDSKIESSSESLLHFALSSFMMLFLENAFSVLKASNSLPKVTSKDIESTGYIFIIKFLLNYGMDIDINYVYRKIYIDNSTPFSMYSEEYRTVLTDCAKSGNYTEVVNLVTELGADVNANNSPPKEYYDENTKKITTLNLLLFDIANHGKFGQFPKTTIKIIKFLISCGAIVDDQDKRYLTLTDDILERLLKCAHKDNLLGNKVRNTSGYSTEEDIKNFYKLLNQAVEEGLTHGKAQLQKLAQNRHEKIKNQINCKGGLQTAHTLFANPSLVNMIMNFDDTPIDHQIYLNEMKQKREHEILQVSQSLFINSEEIAKKINDYEGMPNIHNQVDVDNSFDFARRIKI